MQSRPLRALRTWVIGSWVWRYPESRRLIVYVDDLDRCNTDCIVETLDAVRMVMDREDVIVVVAIDHRIALKAIGEHYSALADGHRSKDEIARDYLGKIIQLPIRLHDAREEHLKQFVYRRLFEGTEQLEGTEEPSPGQPGAVASKDPSSAARTKQQPVVGGKTPGDQPELKPVDTPEKPPEDAAQKPPSRGFLKRAGDFLGGLYPDPLEQAARDEEEQAQKEREAAKVVQSEFTAARELMEHTPTEAKLFYELTQSLLISNPRKLTRIRNAYRLLKVTALREPKYFEKLSVPNMDRPAFLLRLLFWHEFLGQFEQTSQTLHEEYVRDRTKPTEMQELPIYRNDQPLCDTVHQAIEARDEKRSKLYEFVKTLVLPSHITQAGEDET